MKIAILTTGTPQNKKGTFNATHQRIKHLINQGQEVEADVFIIRYYENWFIQILRRRKYKKMYKENFFTYDGIRYNNLWLSFSLIDYLQWQNLNQIGHKFARFAKKTSKIFEKYELVSAHSVHSGIIAYYARKKHQVPFAITWHGSDIHSMPKSNRTVKRMVTKICNDASLVFFVSKQLQKEAESIGINVSSYVLYNAVDKSKFKPYSLERKSKLKEINNINGNTNVAFIGGLVPIKNVLQLPDIFKRVDNHIKDVKFYFVGDGNLRPALSERCKALGLNVTFLGDCQVEDMPDIINCFDLVVLPSLNEGLPLIVLECIGCEVPIICSQVGGIPEVLSEEYTVLLGERFTERFASLAISTLKNIDKVPSKLSVEFSWQKTANKEIALYNEVIN